MSKAKRRIAATVIACLAAGLVFTVRAWSEDPDTLKEIAARQKIEAQQKERDIRDACDEALRTAVSQPSKAAEHLKYLLDKIDAYPNFTAETKESLRALVKQDLSQVQKIADGGDPNAGTGTRPALHDPRVEEQKSVFDKARAGALSSKDALAESQDIRKKSSLAILALNMDIDRSNIAPTHDMEFPPAEQWIAMTKLRSKNNQVTEAERAILKALNAVVSVDFKDQHFNGVVDWFQHQMKTTIILDKSALEDVGVNNESSVNVTLNKVTTRTALKKVLADLGLTYVVKDEAIYVTTPAKAKDMMTVRTYYIGDLLAGGGYPDIRFGGLVSQYQMLAEVAQLVQMIQGNIDADSWAANGKDGAGTIVFDPVHMTLIVKQSSEIHYKMMQGLLGP